MRALSRSSEGKIAEQVIDDECTCNRDPLALAAGLPLVDVAMRLARLEAGGWIAQADGWFEVVGSPLP